MTSFEEEDLNRPLNMGPKPRRGKVSPEEKEAQDREAALARRAELQEEGAYVSPLPPEHTYPSVEADPPLSTIEDLQRLESAAAVFADDLTPADRAKLEAEMALLKEANIPGAPSAVPMGLHIKLAQVMRAVGYVPKTGKNQAQGYAYAEAAAVADTVRQELSWRNITFVPEAIKDIEMIPSLSGKQMIFTAVWRWRITDGETGESIEVVSVGCGADFTDKAPYKAATGALKYALLTTFLIPTGDDPENEKPEPTTGSGDISITQSNATGFIQGGRQKNATEPQLNAIRDSARALGLGPDELRSFVVSAIGTAPDISALEPKEQVTVLLSYLGGLSFEECGQVVRGLVEAARKNNGGGS